MKKTLLALALLTVLICSGCALNQMTLVNLPAAQKQQIAEIVSRRTDGNPPMAVGEINALSIAPGGLNPPGKILRVTFILNLKKSGAKYYLFGLATLDVNNSAEQECLRVIDNFRKAGLPSEFTDLCVTAELPGEFRSTDFKTYGESTFCAYVIDRDQLTNGSPPRQTFKNFRLIE